jgi:hypothetical protein
VTRSGNDTALRFGEVGKDVKTGICFRPLDPTGIGHVQFDRLGELFLPATGLHDSMRRFEKAGIRCTPVAQESPIERRLVSNTSTQVDSKNLLH